MLLVAICATGRTSPRNRATHAAKQTTSRTLLGRRHPAPCHADGSTHVATQSAACELPRRPQPPRRHAHSHLRVATIPVAHASPLRAIASALPPPASARRSCSPTSPPACPTRPCRCRATTAATRCSRCRRPIRHPLPRAALLPSGQSWWWAVASSPWRVTTPAATIGRRAAATVNHVARVASSRPGTCTCKRWTSGTQWWSVWTGCGKRCWHLSVAQRKHARRFGTVVLARGGRPPWWVACLQRPAVSLAACPRSRSLWCRAMEARPP
jgi:hypothetical protein